jgi:hypothetical protein
MGSTHLIGEPLKECIKPTIPPKYSARVTHCIRHFNGVHKMRTPL